MDESSLIQKVHPDRLSVINYDNKVSPFIDYNKFRKSSELKEILPTHIVRKIVDIPIQINYTRTRSYGNIPLMVFLSKLQCGK